MLQIYKLIGRRLEKIALPVLAELLEGNAKPIDDVAAAKRNVEYVDQQKRQSSKI